MRILCVALVALLSGCQPKDPPEEPEVFDVQANLAVNVPQQMQLGSEQHTLTLVQATGNRAIITIQSEPQTWAFYVGVPQELNLNGEGDNDAIVTLIEVGDGTVSLLIQNISTSGSGGGGAPEPTDGWNIPVTEDLPGTVLFRITLNGQSGHTELYDIAPQKDSCDSADPTLFDAYVAETAGRTRINHLTGSSPGFPYFSILTQEARSRYVDCLPPGGFLHTVETELMLDEKRGVDLEGNGSVDVDVVLKQVVMPSGGGEPTLSLTVYAR